MIYFIWADTQISKYILFKGLDTPVSITKTCLFKYTENFTVKKWNKNQIKILIFFIFLLKT